MPFRNDPKYGEFRTKIQFATASWMPWHIYQACLRTGVMSNTRYCQEALCEKLARDLDLDLDLLLENLPTSKRGAFSLFDPTRRDTAVRGPKPKGEDTRSHTRIAIARYGMGNTDEEVR